MRRVPAVAAAALAFGVSARASEPVRVRGDILSLTADRMIVHTTSGADAAVKLGAQTRFFKVSKLTLDAIEPGSYIGTAAKYDGATLVALEVVVFPPAMKGVGEGHRAWDRLPDPEGHGTTATTMTNGSVAAPQPGGGVATTMTNGTVAATSMPAGTKQLTVTYKGGKQVIQVPPSAAIVTFRMAARSDLTTGIAVFINATKDDETASANAVIMESGGVKPPM